LFSQSISEILKNYYGERRQNKLNFIEEEEKETSEEFLVGMS
jgi:hypothetical protein